jgi:hypothetical protein
MADPIQARNRMILRQKYNVARMYIYVFVSLKKVWHYYVKIFLYTVPQTLQATQLDFFRSLERGEKSKGGMYTCMELLAVRERQHNGSNSGRRERCVCKLLVQYTRNRASYLIYSYERFLLDIGIQSMIRVC